MLSTDKKETENILRPLPFFCLFCTIVFTRSNIFFAFKIKFGKTKQIVVTFIATTLKTLLSVTKTNSRLSRHKFYAGNIYYSFLNIFAHTSPVNIQKVRQPKSAHRKTQTPIVAKQSLHSIALPYHQAEVALLPKRVSLMVLKETIVIP